MTVQYVTGGTGSDQCTVESADGSAGEGRTYRLTSEQAANAATISAVGTTRGMPERAVTIALATALQESGLRNIEHGDRDSLGLFQQRPSQGWGTEKQILDPVYSAGKFYEHLAEVPGYSRLPLTVAAQRVQRSGFPQAYAKHEPDAALLAAALTGRAPAALNCDPPRSTAGTGEAAKVRAALVGSFGKDVLPSEDAAAAETPAAGAAAGTGTLSVPVQTARRAGQDGIPQRGWELAHWAVAQSEALGIDEVAYAGKKWDSGSGWRTERKDSGTTAVRMRLAQ
ncbi:hypothetical protein OG696_13630 [Streptomyces sp. NBC_00656]|uniref:Heavy metal transporter n=2 Tax=Streptomyces TaxID=1883 RepID=A0ABY9ISA0_9ACTN|nr:MULTISPECIES: hypothetical protein [unclassified Streptomyces]MDP5314538.1 hypothetical protein [Streptomyces sp. Alt4]WLQ56551.1 hypothetical protein P8A19_14365 [Streptomyces sp. Alt2]WSI68407.1 hypothetical protein OG471_27660 [Streptomyces sp. NBC_01336]